MKPASKAVLLDRVFPVMNVIGGLAVSKKGIITAGWELTLPVAYTQNEKQYDGIIDALAAAIRILPPWTVVHRQDMYIYEDYGSDEPGSSYLGRANVRHFEGRRHLSHRSYLFVSLCRKGLVEKNDTDSGLFGLGRPIPTPSSEVFAGFRTKCEEFTSIMAGCGIRMRTLTDSDWLGDSGSAGVIQRYMMLGDSSPVMSDVAFTPESVSVYDRKAMCFTIGDADQLPSEISTVSRVDDLSGPMNDVYLSAAAKIGTLLDCEHVVNQIIVVPSQPDMQNHLEAEKKKMVSGFDSADNRLNAEEIQAFQDDAYRDGLFVVRAHTNIILWGSKDEQMQLVGKASSAFTKMNVQAVFNRYNTPSVYYACIPSNAYEIGLDNLMLMELKSSLCLAPYETYDAGMKGAVLTLCDRARHIPIGIDTQRLARELGYIDNYNHFVLGASGTGKSFTTNLYVRNCYDRGEDIFIIDVGDSYEGQCNIVREISGGRDGQYFSWDIDHPFSFNPFIGWEGWLDIKGNLKQDENGVNFIMSFLQTVWEPKGGWTSDVIPVLRQMVLDFILLCEKRKRDGNLDRLPILDDFYGYLKDEVYTKMKSEGGYGCDGISITTSRFDMKGFLLALKAYSGKGEFAFLANNPEPADIFSSRFVVFEVDLLSQVNDRKFNSLCILFIMNAFENKMRKDRDRFKVLVIEEAWKAIANETMAPYLAGLWKTSRKFNTAAMVVTQQMTDIMSSSVIKDTILQNSSVRILLDQSNNQSNFDQIADYLGLSEDHRNLILSMNKVPNPYNPHTKEVFIALGDRKCGVYQVEVSPEEAIAFESQKDRKADFLARGIAMKTYTGAIDSIIEERKKQESK